MTITDVTPQNLSEEGLFCIKDPSRPGFASKAAWFAEQHRHGLRLKILRDEGGSQIAFIEYVPAEYAWRPVKAPGFMFIHCISGYRKEHRGKGYASMLIESCEEDARRQEKKGVAVMTSDGAWMASMMVFLKNGYAVADRHRRFELLAKKFDQAAPSPELLNWEENLKRYVGWHVIYADQCPWHDKATRDLAAEAAAHGIELRISRLATPEEARCAPSGFGVFSLVCDGELIEDHYISRTRLRNILRKKIP